MLAVLHWVPQWWLAPNTAITSTCRACLLQVASMRTWRGTALECAVFVACCHTFCLVACGHKQMCWAVPVDTDVEVSIACVGCGQHCSLLVRLWPGGVLHCRLNGERLATQHDGQCLARDELSLGEFLLVHHACVPSPCLATNRGSASLPPTASALPQSGRELR